MKEQDASQDGAERCLSDGQRNEQIGQQVRWIFQADGHTQ